MNLSPREKMFLINGVATVVFSAVQAATLAGEFAKLGVWGTILATAISSLCTLVGGWLNMRKPESLRPPPMPPQVPYGNDLRGP